MVTSPKLTKTEGLPFSDPTLYRSTIGALQYLTLTRPDIAFSVNKLTQFLAYPTDLHWLTCKRVLRYLKGTSTLALQFTPSSHLRLVGFSDTDYASCPDDRRSTGGHCVFFGDNLLLWSSKKQPVVSRSSAESEYHSLANITTELIWIQSFCKEIGLTIPTILIKYGVITQVQLPCLQIRSFTLAPNT
ncbi:uncharacterized mitochondrial protein AtMg00810-like [Salvia miltiorrhiza]|uniref:uncharacterized mitochondrial protein AtMg00810-like n=1 Tax=Salvia miltiorrhiza TaxID=226208 RepID=UPI0025AD78EE|nr:uncharacterized mitochondrial protein AtMg00810-like [Salvia miltiorrhiza]